MTEVESLCFAWKVVEILRRELGVCVAHSKLERQMLPGKSDREGFSVYVEDKK